MATFETCTDCRQPINTAESAINYTYATPEDCEADRNPIAVRCDECAIVAREAETDFDCPCGHRHDYRLYLNGCGCGTRIASDGPIADACHGFGTGRYCGRNA